MGIQDTGPWHPRWNSEICNLYKELNIMDCIKMMRLRMGGSYCKNGRLKDPKKSS
jgi:hypothetical protein